MNGVPCFLCCLSYRIIIEACLLLFIYSCCKLLELNFRKLLPMRFCNLIHALESTISREETIESSSNSTFFMTVS